MRLLLALTLLLATFATQASEQTAPSISTQFAGAHAQSTIGSEPTKAAYTIDDGHRDGSGDQTHQECASVGHCASSALGASSTVFISDYNSALKPAAFTQTQVGSGFTSPPYRPPATGS